MVSVETGFKAPDFELPSHDGGRVRLSDFKGRVVVLYFYPRAMTPGCTREGVRFNQLIDEFERIGAVVLGVSTDTVDDNRRFAERMGFKFRLLSDVDGRVAKAYGVLKEAGGEIYAERVTFVIDSEGVVRAVIKGVSPEEHAERALREAKRLSSSSS